MKPEDLGLKLLNGIDAEAKPVGCFEPCLPSQL